MKLVKEDVVATVFMFILFLTMFSITIKLTGAPIISHIAIIYIDLLAGWTTWLCFISMKRYETKKVPVRGQHSLFKFFFYGKTAILVYKNNIDVRVFNYGDGDIEKLKRINNIEIIFYTNRKGKDAGYKINPWKYADEPMCPYCEGYGTIVSRPARAMGYTIGPDEDPYILDEQLIPCVCRKNDK